MKSFKIFRSKPFIIGVSVVIFTAAVAFILVWKLENLRIEADKSKTATLSGDYAHSIEQAIETSISATYALSALVRQGNGDIEEFESIAQQMLPFYPVTTLQLAPNGVVQKIVPLQGNEGAIGHDIFQDPARSKEANLAKLTGKLTLAGPFDLKQGGVGVVARLPVFLDKNDGEQSFWGFTVALIRLHDALKFARLSQLATRGYRYELWRTHPDTREKQVIDASFLPPVEPVDQILKLPNGIWTLSVAPDSGWVDVMGVTLKSSIGLLLSLMLGSIAVLVVKMKKYQDNLEQQVQLRTSSLEAEIRFRKEAETQAQTNEKRFRSLLDNLPDLIWMKDENGTYLFCNKQFERFFGAKEQDIVGKNDYDFVDKELADFFRKHDLLAINAGKPSSNEEWITYPDDDQRVLLYTTKTPVFNANYTILGVLGIGRDISPLREGDEVRAELEAKLQQAQKMEAIGTLAGGIAHDFNNILSVILGYSELAHVNSPADSEIKRDLSMVVEASHRAKDLVRQILAFSRQAKTENQIIQPASILKETIKLLRSSIPSTIEIRHDISAEDDPVYIDPTHLHQILTNLSTNAWHAMEETGGVLTISLCRKNLYPSDIIGQPNVEPGAFMHLSVSDTGTGVEPELIKKIFDPYFTTKAVGKGTGMGLAIIHGLAKNAGGFVTCESSPGNGATFNVFIPLYSDSTPLGDAASHEVKLQHGSERILFVDDEKILAEMSKTTLERLGYHVTVKTSSIEALEAVQNRPDSFDLVITDQTMPAMTGTDLARRLLQIRPTLPIILTTGFSTTISEEKAKMFGIKAFAMKPLTMSDMASLIRKVLIKDH